jgi:hypothetical protein
MSLDDYISVLGFISYHAVVFVFLVMFQYLFSKIFKKAANVAFHQTIKSMLFGVVYLIAAPIAGFLLLMTLVGIPFGLMLLFSYAISILLLILITPVLIANLINRSGNFNLGLWRLSLLSLIVLWVITLSFRISVLGWIVLGILSGLSLGSLLNNINWRRVTESISLIKDQISLINRK